MQNDIAILGLSCEFPGARTPEDLWETAILKRRWFRAIPATRLGRGYIDVLGESSDTTRLQRAAFIEGYSFPQQKFSLGSNDLVAADLSHWLALDCADRALTDSGLADALPRDSTRVIVGNSLTGESSRADLLRLRWPYVRKTLEESGCSGSETDWGRREQFFKARLTTVDGRTLAGSLSNVIAGRIANHFNMRGGAYCVDAACASSLVAIAQACSQLATHEIDCCVVGGVDVSLDPLELVGFSVAGALANEEMTVFDRNRSGFLPGEGCGFAVLMRADYPAVANCRVRALIRGWSVSSDGRHDLTAPSPDGQRLALERAYSMAGYGIETVALFEAHGTGTKIGDEVEIGALNSAIACSSVRKAVPAVISSIKANIGHTKAAAGIAGVIKAVMALESRILPPVTGCNDPMSEITSDGSHLRLLQQAAEWPEQVPLRAGVSGFGFGGVNAHITLEAPSAQRAPGLSVPVQWNVSEQDAEIFVFDGLDVPDLSRRIEKVKAIATSLAAAELAPAGAATVHTLKHRPWRAAAVASSPRELDQRLAELLQCLAAAVPEQPANASIFIGRTDTPPRIGFLFPGQGGREKARDGKIWTRFRSFLNGSPLVTLTGSPPESAAAVQSAIVSCSTAATKLLRHFGVEPSACLGHSLGEISALHAGGVLSEIDAVALARDRGGFMDERPSTRGRMEVIFGDAELASRIVDGYPVSLAAFNSSTQTVITGEAEAVAAATRRASEMNVRTVPLSTSFAFHSPLMQTVAEPFSARLRQTSFSAPQVAVFSTVTGDRLAHDSDFTAHLTSQLTSPVRFTQAVEAARQHIDLWIEVGAGRVLSGLISPVKSTSTETERDSLIPFLQTLAVAFVHGADVHFEALFTDRRLAPFDLDWIPCFFTNPCERQLPPMSDSSAKSNAPPQYESAGKSFPIPVIGEAAVGIFNNPLEAVRHALVTRKGLGVSAHGIRPNQTLGPDLGVDSLGLTELTIAVQKALGCRPSGQPLKKMTVAEFASLFQPNSGATVAEHALSDLLVPWVRAFDVVWDETPLAQAGIEPVISSDTAWLMVESSNSVIPADFAAHLPPIAGSLLIQSAADADELFLERMLAALRTHSADAPVVFLDSTGQLPGFAKSFALEHSDQRILFVHYSANALPDASVIAAELHDIENFREVRYDANGHRLLPRCCAVRSGEPLVDLPLSSEDVILVTGGAKGITAECMLALAGTTGAKFAIVGRSHANIPDVVATRQKLAEMGIAHEYWAVDVSDPVLVATLLRDVSASLGPITAIIHGAGTHEPCPIRELTAATLHEHCRPKVEGLRNLLSHLAPSSLKLVVAFGSVIARSGYVRSGAYAFANDSLARLVSDWQKRFPATRFLTLDWSVWLETGMGVSLQAISPLKAAGVDPIRTKDGVAAFLDALCQPSLGTRPILTGRLPAFPTVSFRTERPSVDLPLAKLVSHTPGVEIVVDATMSLSTHPFLAGHTLEGRIILPGVLSAEFMVKIASLLAGFANQPHVRNVTFHYPIALQGSGAVTIRIQAVQHPNGIVKCRLAPNGENLAVDPAASSEVGRAKRENQASSPRSAAAQLDPIEGTMLAEELYQHLLFHKGQFQIVDRYLTATAKTAVFHLRHPPQITRPIEDETVIRDAFVHGIQICVPGELLLPKKVASIARYLPARAARTVIATEVSSRDDEFFYDLTALDANGHIVEAWEGLLLCRYRLVSNSALHPLLRSIQHDRSGVPLHPPTPTTPSSKRYYEHRHVVGFKETNVVGNVYFTNHLEWQGRCREMFLREHAPDVLVKIEAGQLVLATTSCSCEYEEEVRAFDEISIRMFLEATADDCAHLTFEYWVKRPSGAVRIAQGSQTVASRMRKGGRMSYIPLPSSLVSALEPFR